MEDEKPPSLNEIAGKRGLSVGEVNRSPILPALMLKIQGSDTHILGKKDWETKLARHEGNMTGTELAIYQEFLATRRNKLN